MLLQNKRILQKGGIAPILRYLADTSCTCGIGDSSSFSADPSGTAIP
jgi:hypothetical protein